MSGNPDVLEYYKNEHSKKFQRIINLASHNHTKGRLTGSETDNEDVYTFKTPNNILCQEFRDLLMDNMDVPTTPLSAYQTQVGESVSWSAQFPGKTIVGQSDSASSNDNYVPMIPGSSTLLAMERAEDNSQMAPTAQLQKKSTDNVDYLSLDFQPGSLSPHHKPSTSSVTSDEKANYVQ
ncbi:hypothetical protein A6R68_22030, partial [Neotoma lepida]